MLKHLESVIFFVDDVGAAAAWYAQILGSDIGWENPRYAFVRAQGLVLGFHPADTKCPGGVGGTTAYWEVDNLEEAIAFLVKRGARLHRGPALTNFGAGAAMLIDPFGCSIGLNASTPESRLRIEERSSSATSGPPAAAAVSDPRRDRPVTLSAQPLSRQPGLKPLVSAWLLSEWPAWYGAGGSGDLSRDIDAFASSEHQLPVGFVVFADEEPVGFASLKQASIDSHPHLYPWAASGYVVPARRGQGVGAFLLGALCDHARLMGHPQVYCGTSTATGLLRRAGWFELEQVVHAGKPLAIFCSAG